MAAGSFALGPKWVEGRLEEREHLLFTLSLDHDLVAGVPAARFTSRLAERLREASELQQLVIAEA